ncbi:MAG: hypothetical protein HY864_00455 [Chloroflexi bacterium]|nr:hypothetical protein [Chloroflexota bacterium]
MIEFYKFLASYEVPIYILLAIGGLFSFRWLYRSWREWQTAIYSLERQFSIRRLGQSGTISALIIILFCFELSMTSFVIPGLPSDFFLATPTHDFIATPTGTLSAEMMTQFANSLPRSTAVNTIGCTPNQIMLTSPNPGEEIKGSIELVGTVNIPNFGFYKYEVAPQGSATWATISAGRATVNNGPLGRWDTTALTPGDYQLRLVVTDNQGQPMEACIVPVRVVPVQ